MDLNLHNDLIVDKNCSSWVIYLSYIMERLVFFCVRNESGRKSQFKLMFSSMFKMCVMKAFWLSLCPLLA